MFYKSLKSVSSILGPNKIYGCEVRRRHHLERKIGGGYDAQEYDEHPERYISTFAQKVTRNTPLIINIRLYKKNLQSTGVYFCLQIAPYTSVVLNGIYWAVGSPKLLTIPDAKHLLLPSHTPWLPKSIGAPALPHR